jgi:predicted TIM-barrel fold metal-dependent hydrolase
MVERNVIQIINKVNELKKQLHFEIIDSHVHPYDVMGVVHYSETIQSSHINNYLRPGLLELFNYGRIEKLGSQIYFKFFQKSIFSTIQSIYKGIDSRRILDEMNVSLVDKTVLLPLEPWVPTEFVCEKFKNNDQFYKLASIDVHAIEVHRIEPLIVSYIDKFNIIGIKLHPNLQNFKPIPRQNPLEIQKKLEKIYEVATKNKLYLLFHGGISNYTKDINSKYDLIKRSKTNALLHNFCDLQGRSELFDKYDVPIIIAHMGSYGLINPNYKLIKHISDIHRNVFFDTSGISPYVIENVLNCIPSTKIIFGSDGLYNRMSYNIAYLYLAAKRCNNGENVGTILMNIFCNNFYKRVLCR